MEPGEIIFSVQWFLAIGVAAVYFLRSLLQGGKMDGNRLFQIVSTAISAGALPVGLIFMWIAYDPGALEWLSGGNYRMSFLIVGIGVVVYAASNLKNNWPG